MPKSDNEDRKELDIDLIITETSKQYEVYRSLTDITSIIAETPIEESYERDFNHPLTLQINKN